MLIEIITGLTLYTPHSRALAVWLAVQLDSWRH
jgi:hypothetical protein